MINYKDELVKIQIREIATVQDVNYIRHTTYEFWCRMLGEGVTFCERFHLCNLDSDTRFTEWEKDLIRKLIKESK